MSNKTEIKNIKHLNAILSERGRGMGTDKFYRHPLVPNSLMTDGMKDICELADAFWIFNDVSTVVFAKLRELDEPDKYYLTVTSKDNKGSMILKDYRDREIYNQELTYTDLPEGELLLYVGYSHVPNRNFNPNIPEGKGNQRYKTQLITCIPIED